VHRLLLIRHAKTLQAEPGQADIDRALAPRGERQLPVMRAWLDERLAALGELRVLCSPAQRTRQTWAGCRPHACTAKAHIEDRIYGAWRGELCALLEPRLADGRTLAVVGHNPTLSELFAQLVPDSDEARRGLGTGDMALLGSASGQLFEPWTLDGLCRP
jgi:phosphohistidine phosphatase